MYDIRFALDGAITCRVYQAGYMQAAYWDPGTPPPPAATCAPVGLDPDQLACCMLPDKVFLPHQTVALSIASCYKLIAESSYTR